MHTTVMSVCLCTDPHKIHKWKWHLSLSMLMELFLSIRYLCIPVYDHSSVLTLNGVFFFKITHIDSVNVHGTNFALLDLPESDNVRDSLTLFSMECLGSFCLMK